jgi:Raf kinase inhibitor-like YbhB/YbcL family protein
MGIRNQVEKLAGRLLRPIRAGSETIATANDDAPPLEVTTPSFGDGSPIPARHVADHNVSPALAWRGVPAQTREVVVLVEDPDAPAPKAFVHWSVYGVSPRVTSLPEGVGTATVLPEGATEGKNSLGETGFFGPKPPRGHGIHHYHFQVFALDAPLGLGPGVDRDALVEAMRGHVLAQGDVVGTYENP